MPTSVSSNAGLVAAADKCILALKPFVEFTKLFSTNYAPVNGEKFSAIAVEVLSSDSEDFDPSTGKNYCHSTNKVAPATVALQSHRKSTYTISDRNAIENELAPCWAKFGPKAAEAVGKYAVQSIMSLLTYSAATAQITQATYASLADFTAIWGKALALGLDPRQCVLILSPGAYAALLSVLPAYVIGDDRILRSAMIGEFLGWKAVVPSPNASLESASGTNNGYGFIVPEGAIATANRIVTPVREGGNLIEFGTITDEATGFSFGQRVVIDADQGTCSWSVDCLFGKALTKQNSNGAPGFYQLITA
jgi:hypothetical protein